MCTVHFCNDLHQVCTQSKDCKGNLKVNQVCTQSKDCKGNLKVNQVCTQSKDCKGNLKVNQVCTQSKDCKGNLKVFVNKKIKLPNCLKRASFFCRSLYFKIAFVSSFQASPKIKRKSIICWYVSIYQANISISKECLISTLPVLGLKTVVKTEMFLCRMCVSKIIYKKSLQIPNG